MIMDNAVFIRGFQLFLLCLKLSTELVYMQKNMFLGKKVFYKYYIDIIY